MRENREVQRIRYSFIFLFGSTLTQNVFGFILGQLSICLLLGQQMAKLFFMVFS